MTTAAVQTAPEMRLVSSLRALKAAHKTDTMTLAQRIGVSRSTWFGKMSSGDFTVREAVGLADFYGVTVQSLLDGQVTLPYLAPKLAALAGGGATTAPRTPLLHTVPSLARANG